MKLQQAPVQLMLVCLSFFILQRPVLADVIIPPAAATTEGSLSAGTGVNGFFTEQVLYQGSDLTGLNVGDVITGYRNRLDVSETAAAPTTPQTWNRLDVTLGVGNPVMTTTFADNFASAPTTVRTGSILFPAFATPADGGPTGPHSFGFEVVFDTPYVYTGGPLLFEFRTQTGAVAVDLDVMGPTQTNAMYALGAGDNATEAGLAFGNFGYAMMLSTTSVPEPGSTAILLLGSVVGMGLRCRRRRQLRRAHKEAEENGNRH